ncbi:pyridoxine 5'-phosphate synthase [Pantoea ananatis]
MAELLLGVNIDHIATVRNARGTHYPDPVQAAFIAEQAVQTALPCTCAKIVATLPIRDVRILRDTIETRMNL